MSLVDSVQARRAFASLPDDLRLPCLEPAYVLADVCRDDAAVPVFFVYRKGGETWYHPLVRRPVPGTDLFDLESAYGYGGPVATTDDPGFLAEADAAWQDWCGKNRILAEFIRFHPLLENQRFSMAESQENRTTVWIDLTRPDIRAGLQPRLRTAVRKAEKDGVTVRYSREENDLRIFAAQYTETMARIGASADYFFPMAYFQGLLAHPELRLGLAEHNGRTVAAAMFLAGAGLWEYHLCGVSPTGQQLGAVKLLICHAAETARAEGMRRLHLGGGTDDAMDNPLLYFKAKFSSARAAFRIGRRVHRPEDYAALLRDWTRRHGVSPSRLLFYHGQPEPGRSS
ncbi:GNAT family N-acetyltransferase [Solidesulfovibrio sp.]|uniref:GNAT family N-acetyltransferase n=1 Tax=Solidesulfovibrio sp. TaxID=2910990 RepID=UPI002B1FD08F|nr:GNAT family N-acetyltransferase [Solidesulfovibrio sp.]MEA5088411.1 GNAT family N-acetyltransferase [Solidesulfovibrio sp.]